MAEKRKPETLSVEQKDEILQMLERGQSRRIIAEKYASDRWFQHFRNRNRINPTNIRQDSPTPSTAAGNTFRVHFSRILQNEEFKLENVYNAGYTPIMWKSVPKETSIFRRGQSTASQKMCGNHVTTLLCANVTGCHKLPVLIIGRTMEPQSSNNLNTNTFSIMYRANTNAWMDSTIFNEWFTECFLESVKKRQEKNGRREKTLLLLDNSKLHPDLNDLNKKDEFVTVMSPSRIRLPPTDLCACWIRRASCWTGSWLPGSSLICLGGLPGYTTASLVSGGGGLRPTPSAGSAPSSRGPCGGVTWRWVCRWT
ncbi:jerky protein homolog-like [Bombus pascuorum]|uniref:jerky protein homolog-like n=1 Tax=Bombus pascuorum TaxID=65598 RepID=UPI00298E864A|nr:jerky protein homolog-like [Bombus pascuorum]